MQPETRYAKSGDVHIAYQVLGEGPRDLVFVPGLVSHVEFLHELPGYTDFLRGLARFARVIVFDKRGNGLSDRLVGALNLEERMDDISAVMEAVGSKRAALLAVSEGGPLSLVFAATYPERVEAIVLYETFVRFGGTSDYPFGPPRDRHSEITAIMVDWHGTGMSLWIYGAHHKDDPRVQALWGRAERLSATPGAARALFEMLGDMDVRGVLPSVRAPCLVIHGTSSIAAGFADQGEGSMFVDHGRYLAEHLPDARRVVLEGIDHYPWFANADAIVTEVEEFLTGTRTVVTEPDRVLATVLFTDIVGSTERAAVLGDRRWRDLLDRYYGVLRREIARFRGREVKTLGDGVLATFDGPARAIRCGCAIRDGVRPLGIEVRVGLHTGECELMDNNDVGGIAVHIGARVVASAAAGEVLVSGTVKDLVAGSGLRFVDRGANSLHGVPGEWRLFAVEG